MAKQADALGFRDLLESFQRNRTEGATYAIDSWRSPSYLNRTAVAVTHIGTGLGEYAVPVESRNLHRSGAAPLIRIVVHELNRLRNRLRAHLEYWPGRRERRVEINERDALRVKRPPAIVVPIALTRPSLSR